MAMSIRCSVLKPGDTYIYGPGLPGRGDSTVKKIGLFDEWRKGFTPKLGDEGVVVTETPHPAKGAEIVVAVRLDEAAGGGIILIDKRGLEISPAADVPTADALTETVASSDMVGLEISPAADVPTVDALTETIASSGMVDSQSAMLVPALRSKVESDDIQELEYKPLVVFVDHLPPGVLKPCRDYVLDDCKETLLGVACLPEVVTEVSKITTSKLGNPRMKQYLEASAVLPAMLFAIILYTFDLCLIDPTKTREENFYYVLNSHLRKRSAEVLNKCHGYLYYLMTGLYRLPPFIGDVLFRGIDALGADRARQEYVQGRLCHWSGFSSATPCVGPSKEFAMQSGPGGLILRIRILRKNAKVRDIREFSAFSKECEVLLLPNFKTVVIQEATFDPSIGLDVIDLLEQSEASVDVF